MGELQEAGCCRGSTRWVSPGQFLCKALQHGHPAQALPLISLRYWTPLVMVRMTGLVQSGPMPPPTSTWPGSGHTCQALGRAVVLGLCLHEQLTVIVGGLGQAEHAPLLADSLRVGDA